VLLEVSLGITSSSNFILEMSVASATDEPNNLGRTNQKTYSFKHLILNVYLVVNCGT